MKERKLKGYVLAKLLGIAACAVMFGLLAWDVTGNYVLKGFDESIFYGIRHFECQLLTVFFKIMTNMVNPVVLLIMTISTLHFFKQKRYLVALLGNLVLTILLNVAIKGNIMRVRPPQEWRLIYESGYSFPSGHSMVSASFYGFVIFLIWQTHFTKKHKKQGMVLCLLMILLVGCSRIYLGVHYATDVIAGFLVSTMYLLCYTAIVKRYLAAEALKLQKNPLQNQRLFMSFKYAFDGIIEGLRNEKNMMIHYSALVLVLLFGITLKLTKIEWSICLILCGLVIAMEQMNTALEAAIDLVTEDKKPLAKLAKDTAAGAVLVAAITAAAVGILVFLPKLIYLFTV